MIKMLFMNKNGDSDPNFENCDLFHAQSRTPDAVFKPVPGGQTRDVDVRR